MAPGTLKAKTLVPSASTASHTIRSLPNAISKSSNLVEHSLSIGNDVRRRIVVVRDALPNLAGRFRERNQSAAQWLQFLLPCRSTKVAKAPCRGVPLLCNDTRRVPRAGCAVRTIVASPKRINNGHSLRLQRCRAARHSAYFTRGCRDGPNHDDDDD
jgi:hypothetical protein